MHAPLAGTFFTRNPCTQWRAWILADVGGGWSCTAAASKRKKSLLFVISTFLYAIDCLSARIRKRTGRRKCKYGRGNCFPDIHQHEQASDIVFRQQYAVIFSSCCILAVTQRKTVLYFQYALTSVISSASVCSVSLPAALSAWRTQSYRLPSRRLIVFALSQNIAAIPHRQVNIAKLPGITGKPVLPHLSLLGRCAAPELLLFIRWLY